MGKALCIGGPLHGTIQECSTGLLSTFVPNQHWERFYNKESNFNVDQTFIATNYKWQRVSQDLGYCKFEGYVFVWEACIEKDILQEIIPLMLTMAIRDL